ISRYKLEVAVTGQMYDTFLNLDFWRYDEKENIDLYEKATEFARSFPYLLQRVSQLLGAIAALIGGLLAIMTVNRWLGLLIAGTAIPSVWLQIHISHVQADFWRKHIGTRRKANAIGNVTLMNPANIAELRLYGVIKYLLAMYTSYRDQSEKAEIELER